MKLPMRLFTIVILINFLNLSLGNAQNINLFTFTEEELKELKVRKIRGAENETKYSVGSNDKGNFLKAIAQNGGSGLGKEIEVDLEKTPFINITWKVEKGIKGIDEKSKKGHDFAARVFVVKKTGLTPLSNKAINYVFSSNNSVGEYWRSPYTKSSVDFVLSIFISNDNR